MFDTNFHGSSPLRQYEISHNYVCKRCDEGGHHILNCPTNLDPSFDVPPDVDYECSICHGFGIHYGTLCPDNVARNSITQQRFRHAAFMERAKRSKFSIREYPESTEGRLKFSDEVEDLAIEDTEMGDVSSTYCGDLGFMCGTGRLRFSDEYERPVLQDKEMGTDTKLHSDRARQLELEQHTPTPYEDFGLARATSGANSQPAVSRIISGTKRKMGDGDHDGLFLPSEPFIDLRVALLVYYTEYTKLIEFYSQMSATRKVPGSHLNSLKLMIMIVPVLPLAVNSMLKTLLCQIPLFGYISLSMLRPSLTSIPIQPSSASQEPQLSTCGTKTRRSSP